MLYTTFHVVRKRDGRLYLKYELFGLISLDLAPLKRVGAEYKRFGHGELIVGFVDGTPRQILVQKIKGHALSSAWHGRLGNYQTINTTGTVKFVKER